jgi:hypothetical protein
MKHYEAYISPMYNIMFRVVSGTEQNNKTSLFFPWMSKKAPSGLKAFTPEMDCDHTAMDLPPATSAVFCIAKSFW